MDAAADAIVSALSAAMDDAVPTKLARMGGHGNKASPALRSAIRESKSVFWEWKQAGRPPPGHPRFEARKEAKRNLRSVMRHEENERRLNLFSELMTKLNDKAFFRLINQNREPGAREGAIVVDGQPIFDPQDQCQAWARYFSQLAVPSTEPHFDQEYLERVESEVALIDLLSDECKSDNPFTVEEVCKAINNLNTGKAADEDGLCAEGIKLVTLQVAPILCVLFNHMRLLSHVPASLKRGILTLIGKKGNHYSIRTTIVG